MKKLLVIWVLLILGSCREAPDIPEVSNLSLIVVEGWLSDREEFQQVKVSSTVNFTSGNDPVSIANARVRIHNVTRETYRNLTHTSDGLYVSDDPFKGIAGQQYILRIELATGEEIVSEPEYMADVSPIDSVTFDFFTRESEEDPQTEELIYYPIAHSSDPADENNFYRWKLARNDTIFSDTEFIFIFSDRFIEARENYPQEFLSYEYHLNDTARVEIMEISKNAFEFLRQLKQQTSSLGTNTAVTPAPIRGNLNYMGSNKVVLGFFGTVSVNSMTAQVIHPD